MEGLEVRELDQLVHVLVIATVMLALMAVGLYGRDLHRRAELEAFSAPSPAPVVAPASRNDLFRALVSDLR